MSIIRYKLLNGIIDSVYPRRCPICQDIALPRTEKACSSCRDLLMLIQEPKCKKCGKPIEKEEAEFCFDCSMKQFHYEQGFCLWVYNKTMKQSISAFKFRNKKEYADFYIEELWHYGEVIIKGWDADVLIPIPIHRIKLQKRGYNQADILARGISRHLGIPVLSNYLLRDKNTQPQKELNDRERLKNLRNAFSVSEKEAVRFPNLNRVILVDDIYTTGSTIEACTNILLEYGIRKVYFIALSIGRGY